MTDGRDSGSGSGPERIGELLGGFLDRQGVSRQLAQMSAVDDWAERVGPAIARVTRARNVAEGTLVVEVQSSAWLMELNMMKREILTRVNRDRDVPLEKLVFVLSPEG